MGKNETREIDLLDLLQSIAKSIGNFFVNIYNAIWWLIAFAIKKYIPLVVFLLIGTVLGIYSVIGSDKGYKSYATIRTNAVRSYEMVDYFNNISKYLKQKKNISFPILHEKFGLDSLVLDKIQSFHAHFYVDYWGDGTLDEIDFNNKHSIKDTINIRDSLHLCLEVVLKDPNVFPEISPAINNFINQEKFLVAANNRRLNKIGSNLQLINTELEYLDSLQQVSYFSSGNDMAQLQMNSTRGFILGEKRQQLYHNDKNQLQSQKANLENEIFLYSDIITVINDFPIVTEVQESDYYIIIKNSIFSFLFGYILLLLIYVFKKNYKRYLDKI